ncbi:hypothetical protein DFH07DRAFT_1062726 [Mycena maculata]|uniref:Uncharacterized protein n=1 Tax=Mycena maculata TaxID=230809 RepID=A0AAD7IR28_9AGAR|nr:hypothetical protein DFH07DRAFT_1063255 [Mycena maculata]KAJ7747423.1 hypothetical protein DFH07DRAFT_1062726 [Mycena maculata]
MFVRYAPGVAGYRTGKRFTPAPTADSSSADDELDVDVPTSNSVTIDENTEPDGEQEDESNLGAESKNFNYPGEEEEEEGGEQENHEEEENHKDIGRRTSRRSRLPEFDNPNLDKDVAIAGILENDNPYPEMRSAVVNTDDLTVRAWTLDLFWAIKFFFFWYPAVTVTNLLITIMACVPGAGPAYATDIIAVQRVYYAQAYSFGPMDGRHVDAIGFSTGGIPRAVSSSSRRRLVEIFGTNTLPLSSDGPEPPRESAAAAILEKRALRKQNPPASTWQIRFALILDIILFTLFSLDTVSRYSVLFSVALLSAVPTIQLDSFMASEQDVSQRPSVGAFAPPRSSTQLPTSELIDILPSSHCSVLSLTQIVSKDAHCIVPDDVPLLFM